MNPASTVTDSNMAFSALVAKGPRNSGTNADLSNTKDDGACQETRLVCTQRPEYKKLSPPIPPKVDRVATVNPTHKAQLLSRTEPGVRRQSAKPTDKSTLRVNAGIEERCENPTTTEKVKLPTSSSIPANVACLIVNTVVRQNLNSESQKPESIEPKNLSCVLLTSLIAGDSEVHTNTRERRSHSNEPHKICQIRKLPASTMLDARLLFSLLSLVEGALSNS
ncbi:hypothetical protein T265_03770 [Opisthorchis viverrini]|uniref:Uncharacterized protein n=1 Tax=Opisthorchis viverrini TaxID=6198 RepID=A0A074ZQK7_OPIVI|nr:hypothetical protein T265_03770 [Opisthorchis viverrini]KER29663.1 hypothetical protein T265_03770 [Opisthorchis viverrini]